MAFDRLRLRNAQYLVLVLRFAILEVLFDYFLITIRWQVSEDNTDPRTISPESLIITHRYTHIVSISVV